MCFVHEYLIGKVREYKWCILCAQVLGTIFGDDVNEGIGIAF